MQPVASGSEVQDHDAKSDNIHPVNHGGTSAGNGMQPNDSMDIDEQLDNIYGDHVYVHVDSPLRTLE